MKHRNVPLAEIHVPGVRVTAVYDEELQEQLNGSLDAVGQLQPIVLVQREEGYELVDGLHRLEEAQKRGDRTIPAVVYPGDSGDALLLNLVTNRLRGKTKASEMVQVIGELTQVHGMDSDELVRRTGMTRDYIERLWKIAEAHPVVRDALDREVIGVGAAFQISRLPDPNQQEAFLKVHTLYNMTVPEVKERVEEVLNYINEPAVREPKTVAEPAPPQKCEGCEGTPPPNLLTAVIICPECFGLIYKHHQEVVLAQTRDGSHEDSGGTP